MMAFRRADLTRRLTGEASSQRDRNSLPFVDRFVQVVSKQLKECPMANRHYPIQKPAKNGEPSCWALWVLSPRYA
ncbi:hypothetical protein K239x_23720 [Planctomycetes bacterium K23_9]|uniref:Uncharacterized protein n=1 Tax=Stieleria marina TaxID=1930275 RepID=A0A517NTG4_9BACT|nr:hypothetical protein K239x_23720 [Planctomycetes bacterium K23_9]